MLFCRDRLTKDDAVGTTFLNLSKISSSGGEMDGNFVMMQYDIYIYGINITTKQ